MNRRPLILSTLLFAGAGGAGIHLWRIAHPEPSPPAVTAPVVAVKTKPRIGSLPQPIGDRQFSLKERGVSGEEITSTEATGQIPNHLGSGPVPGGGSFQAISEPELRRRAAAVEQEANHDLKNLIGLLDLTETQQDRIFESMVRHAPGWHPAMQAVGVAVPVPVDATAKTPGAADANSNANAGTAPATGTESTASTRNDLLDAIAADLTPDQQVELANAELDRQEWWEEIIPQLLPPEEIPSLASDKGTTGTAVAAAPPPEDDKAGEDPGVLAE